MNTIKLMGIFLLSIWSMIAVGQDVGLKIDKFKTEVGISYPTSLSGEKEEFSVYLKLGYNKLKNNKYIIGANTFSFYDQSRTGDVNHGVGLKLGRIIENKIVSFDLGYTIYSQKYGILPGAFVGLNLDFTERVGIHLRYKELSSMEFEKRKVLEFGIHVNQDNIKKLALPALGVAVIVGVIFMKAVSNSN